MTPKTPKSTVTSSAIKYPDGMVLTGKRHSDVIRTASLLHIKSNSEKCVQGFIVDNDKFVNRWEAKKIAIESGQIEDKEGLLDSQLYSEDLW